jgi:hypothetical protein
MQRTLRDAMVWSLLVAESFYRRTPNPERQTPKFRTPASRRGRGVTLRSGTQLVCRLAYNGDAVAFQNGSSARRSEPDWRLEGASRTIFMLAGRQPNAGSMKMVRDVTDEPRSRRPIFNATLRAAASWLFSALLARPVPLHLCADCEMGQGAFFRGAMNRERSCLWTADYFPFCPLPFSSFVSFLFPSS